MPPTCGRCSTGSWRLRPSCWWLVTFAAKRALAEGAATWDKFVVNGRSSIAVALLLGFLNNWFADQWGGGEFGPVAFLWVVIDIGMPILAVEVALKLWREPELP